jgi:hypothetical protein
LANNQDEPENLQLDIFGGSSALAPHERVDGAIVNKDLNQTIKQKGGSGTVYADSAEAMSQELFGMGTSQLYESTGGTKNKRNTLPKEAQKAFIAGEIKADYDLRSKDIRGSQRQKNEQIVESVQESGKSVRKWLPW